MSSYKQLALPVVALLSSFFVTAGALSPPAMAQQQNEEGAARTADAVTITTASPDSPLQQLVARETARHLQALDVLGESAEELVVASLDDLVKNWPSSAPDAENAAESSSDSYGAQELLGSLKPLAGLVRDHQAFLIPDSQGRDDLRDVLNRFRPGRGTITVGGLDAQRQLDHLVAMMMMDAAGLDHTGMKYRQYESMHTLARALLADEVQILSIPVSTAIQLPLSEGIAMVAFTVKERLDVIIDTATLVELQSQFVCDCPDAVDFYHGVVIS